MCKKSSENQSSIHACNFRRQMFALSPLRGSSSVRYCGYQKWSGIPQRMWNRNLSSITTRIKRNKGRKPEHSVIFPTFLLQFSFEIFCSLASKYSFEICCLFWFGVTLCWRFWCFLVVPLYFWKKLWTKDWFSNSVRRWTRLDQQHLSSHSHTRRTSADIGPWAIDFYRIQAHDFFSDKSLVVNYRNLAFMPSEAWI